MFFLAGGLICSYCRLSLTDPDFSVFSIFRVLFKSRLLLSFNYPSQSATYMLFCDDFLPIYSTQVEEGIEH